MIEKYDKTADFPGRRSDVFIYKKNYNYNNYRITVLIIKKGEKKIFFATINLFYVTKNIVLNLLKYFLIN